LDNKSADLLAKWNLAFISRVLVLLVDNLVVVVATLDALCDFILLYLYIYECAN